MTEDEKTNLVCRLSIGDAITFQDVRIECTRVGPGGSVNLKVTSDPSIRIDVVKRKGWPGHEDAKRISD